MPIWPLLFANRRLANPNRLDADSGATATEIKVTIPQHPSSWPAGFYTVVAHLISPGETAPRTTNELSFPLAPRITTSLPMTVGILTGLMWIPFTWIGGHWIGLFHGLVRAALVLAAWYLFPDHRFTLIPLLIVLVYAITIVTLEKRWRSINAQNL